jgi:hypothetical protein
MQIDPANSWLLAAAEKNLPMFVLVGKIPPSATCMPGIVSPLT